LVNHPIHLHGLELLVTDMGQFGANSSFDAKLDELAKRQVPIAIRQTVIKDTFSVPSNGFVTFRFRADNPGWWLLHCHFGNWFECCASAFY
jgi:FtsP/CotA-like multicopper oxidase with cupredoxin domain